MIVRFGCWLVLLVVYCVALADLEVSTDEIEFDFNTIADNVAFQSEKCNDTNPCQNGCTCSDNVCSCLNGTSGHFYKNLDDCRSKCGYAQCSYNATSRDIYCSCDRGYAFDDYNKICRACDCGSYANSCSYIEGKKKCTCFASYADKQGTCRLCYCNFDSGCEFDDGGRKKCDCLKGYAEQDGDCQRCDCGEHGNCTFFGWRKTCKCKKGYADNYGTCEECDCGEHGNCIFVGMRKTCQCEKGYTDKYGTCEGCDCGEHGNCTSSGWGKTCQCEKGYADKYGTCEECDCGEHGRCNFFLGIKKCSCYSRFAENPLGKCQECDCGENGRCNFFSGIKQCSCDSRFAENHLGKCQECECGDENAVCIFNAGNKQCICYLGFSENALGKCEECNCKMSDSNCTIDGVLRKCQCPTGFEPSKDYPNPVCIDIDECLSPEDNDCNPLSTKCVNTRGSYDCKCKEGFQVFYKDGWARDIKKYGCKDIDECLGYSPCFNLHARCVNTPGSYKCECTAGYSLEKDSLGEKYNYCSEDDRPWKTASIVVGFLFGFVSLGLLISICNKYCCIW